MRINEVIPLNKALGTCLLQGDGHQKSPRCLLYTFILAALWQGQIFFPHKAQALGGRQTLAALLLGGD